MLALIAAMDKNRVIGSDGHIPWQLEGDQKRFRSLTLGKTLIMGRITLEEIIAKNGKPLSGRRTIAVSSTKIFSHCGCTTVPTLSEALEEAKGDVFICGGQSLYEEVLPHADRLYITEIEAHFEGDRFFPKFDKSEFEIKIEGREEGEIPYRFVTYTRKAR